MSNVIAENFVIIAYNGIYDTLKHFILCVLKLMSLIVMQSQ